MGVGTSPVLVVDHSGGGGFLRLGGGATSLVHQVDQVVQHPTHQIFHGPDTIEHFNAFSVDEDITDLQSDAPDVYQLFQTL